jgi:hypothetical protein
VIVALRACTNAQLAALLRNSRLEVGEDSRR